MVSATASGEAGETELLRSEHKLNSVLRWLVSRFIQAQELVVDLFVEFFSTAAACLTVPRLRVAAWCKADSAYSLVAEKPC